MNPIPSSGLHVAKYAGTRFWAVWLDGDLLAVTVYKKGAKAVAETVATLRAAIAPCQIQAAA